jgi:hypothetical protein
MILITESHKALLKPESNFENEFSILKGNEVIVRFRYSTKGDSLNVSPFEYIDEGDFNWGEFIAKIINDKERKRNFVANLTDIN